MLDRDLLLFQNNSVVIYFISMRSRRAIISAFVIGLMSLSSLSSMDIFMSMCYPRLLSSPAVYLQRWQRSRNTLRNLISISGEGLVLHVPWLSQAVPAKAALVIIHCLGHFSDCFSLSYLHSPFASFTPHPPTQLRLSHLLSARFCQTLSPILTTDFLSFIPW